MTRSYTVTSVVTLPLLTARSAARLMKELLRAATDAGTLPAALVDPRDELAAAHTTLQIKLGKRLAEDSPQVRATDRVEGNAFGALADWLLAFARLPVERHPEAAEARGVYDALFPRGLDFVNIRAADEWQEAETRLLVMKEKKLDVIIDKLGGTAFLEEIAFAHEAYGEALGITVAKSTEVPNMRLARDAAAEAVRAYVLQVMASVRKDKPETAALADSLLAPLTQWKDPPRKQTSSGAEEPPVAVVSPEPKAAASPAGKAPEVVIENDG